MNEDINIKSLTDVLVTLAITYNKELFSVVHDMYSNSILDMIGIYDYIDRRNIQYKIYQELYNRRKELPFFIPNPNKQEE